MQPTHNGFTMPSNTPEHPICDCPATLILASASPRRRALLEHAGVAFEVMARNTPEVSFPGDGERTATFNAAAKAAAVFDELRACDGVGEKIVLGADTVVELGGRLYGKPASEAEAEDMLLSLSGRTHRVMTGVSLVGAHREVKFCVTTLVTFRPFALDAVREYMRLVKVLDKAGAYAAQDHGDMLIERLEGSMDNVVGLPVQEVLDELRFWRHA